VTKDAEILQHVFVFRSNLTNCKQNPTTFTPRTPQAHHKYAKILSDAETNLEVILRLLIKVNTK